MWTHIQELSPRWLTQSPFLWQRAHQIKEVAKKCLRTWMYVAARVTLTFSKCVTSAGADTAVHSLPNVSWFYFLPTFKWCGCERLFFLLCASKPYKEVFDLRNPICISSIVSSSYCGILKVRSERPFDNYRKTFWLYYTAFHLLSCRG